MHKLFNMAIDGVPELRLSGDVDQWAAEEIQNAITYANVDKIRISINSTGGSVMYGYGIVSSMMQFKNAGGIIETVNEGVAASAAGWIAACGSKGYRNCFNYSTYLIHGVKNEDGSNSDDEVGDMFQSGIAGILSSCTNMSLEEVNGYMSGESWFNGAEAMSKGMVDNIIPMIDNKVSIPDNCTVQQLYNATKDFHYIPDISGKNRKMDKFNSILGLSAEASEQAGLDALNALVGERDKLKTDYSKLEATNAALSAKLDEIEASRVEEFVNQLEKDGKVDKANHAETVELCANMGLDNAGKVFGLMKTIVKAQNIGTEINQDDKNGEFEKAKAFMNGSDSSDEARKAFFKYENSADFKKYIG